MPNLLFTANDGAHGNELWVTDGTSAGTSLLVDIRPGSIGSDSNGFGFFALGDGTALFRAGDGVHGVELWRTDGTASGTSLLKDLNPGNNSSDSRPSQFKRLSTGQILFSASDSTHGTELWTTDGTAAGTSFVTDLRPGAGGAYPTNFNDLGNGKALFSAQDGSGFFKLWVTDGTAAGTSLLAADLSSPNAFAQLDNGKVIFEGSSTLGQELWISDGTPGGTSQLVDVSGLANNSSPTFLKAIGNGQVLMQASDGTVGTELWMTDGTAAGTSMVKNINANPGNAGSSPQGFTPLGNGITLFQANDGTHGIELWATDGTDSGTSMVLDINPGASGSSPAKFVAIGANKALFRADDGTHGAELWITDGTAGGTSMVADIAPGSTASFPSATSYFTPIGGGRFVFDANDGTSGIELWSTDGTTAGTSEVQDIRPGLSNSQPVGFFNLACFAAGTRILTAAGEIPVEHLRLGMALPTASGHLRPIAWIGHTTIDLDRHPEPARAAPIRILRNAIAPGVPHRDLLLSPDHAIAWRGALIPIHLLVNGATIRREPPRGGITYFHVELATHDLLLAEGLATESYLDTGNRAVFANTAGPRLLHPDLTTRAWDEAACATLLLAGPDVAAAHATLRTRAQDLGHRLTDDPAITLLADGQPLTPGDTVTIPPGATKIELHSRSVVPSDLDPAANDRRRLGIALTSLRLDGQPIPLDSPALTGCHAPEPAWRWTNGAACLHLAPAIHARTLEITRLPHAQRYWATSDTHEGPAPWAHSTAR